MQRQQNMTVKIKHSLHQSRQVLKQTLYHQHRTAMVIQKQNITHSIKLNLQAILTSRDQTPEYDHTTSL
jgi:uncharacterized membrane protein YgaE (UPF0421/DUF939 family)